LIEIYQSKIEIEDNFNTYKKKRESEKKKTYPERK